MNHRPLFTTVMLTAFASASANAHHAATATFDTSQTMEIEGYVTDFSFSNPHINITLMVTDDSGAEREWVATGPAVAGFRRWGWTEATLQEGEYVRLVGRAARHGGPMILMERADIEGGSLLELNPADGSLVRVLTGPKPDQTPADLVIPELTLADGRPNLSGTWLAVEPGSGPRPAAPQFNETGQALQEAFDPTQDPAYTRCEPRGLVGVITGIQSVRVTQNDDFVVLENEGTGTRRLIYLDRRSARNDDHTRLGHSTARYEGDALVIESSQLLDGLSNGRGNELSDMTTAVETYRRADDAEHAALGMSLVITDPGHLSAPWELSWRKLQTHDYEFAETDCRRPVLGSLQ
jgi:hypothetical protein